MEDFQTMFPKRIVACKNPLDVTRIKDITYKSVQNTDLLCDVYLPKKNTVDKKLPVVFLVHGEAPVPVLKDMGCYISYGELVASLGMAAVSFNHRMVMTGSSIRELLDDISDVRGYIRKHADDYSIDSSQTCIFSLSAGMPFAAFNALHDNPGDVRCFVSMYGFGDFRSYLSVLPDRKDLSETIPEIVIGQIGFPMMIVRAGLDMKFVNDSLDRFIQQCLDVNADMDVYSHSTGHHVFDVLDDNRRSHELIAGAMNFIKKHLLRDLY